MRRTVQTVRGLSGLALIVLLLLGMPGVAQGQVQEDCGIVDAIDYPIDSISIENDDFGMYRAGFGGRHAGIDMAFERKGDPVRAAARGRVTFSDVEGWDTEKGVVIIEHQFPDGRTVFTLYGHMEPTTDAPFPRVGQCVRRGDIIGAIGNPKNSAPHLHYEIRMMRASTGGPGYWNTDPLAGGWYHPIEFTERWRLRLSPAYRQLVSASAPPVGMPSWGPNGETIFAALNQIESRSSADDLLWKLDMPGLSGVVRLNDGRILGKTAQNQIAIVDRGRFVATWQPDRPLASAPMRLGDRIVFATTENQFVGYNVDGARQWLTESLGVRLVSYIQSGNLIAIASVDDQGANRFWVLDDQGRIGFSAAAPAPVVPVAVPGGGFLILVATQVNYIGPDLALRSLFDAGISLQRTSTAAVDRSGNVYLYPGRGQDLYAFAPDGRLRWIKRLTAPPSQPPLIGVGGGCLLYVLSGDGTLGAYLAQDGALRGITALYGGGVHGRPALRFLNVSSSDQVQFSAGYLSIATVDGPTLASVNPCQ